MKVKELRRQLDHCDPEASVEFYDVTYQRSAPVNGLSRLPRKEQERADKGETRIVLTNKLG